MLSILVNQELNLTAAILKCDASHLGPAGPEVHADFGGPLSVGIKRHKHLRKFSAKTSADGNPGFWRVKTVQCPIEAITWDDATNRMELKVDMKVDFGNPDTTYKTKRDINHSLMGVFFFFYRGHSKLMFSF